VSKVFESIRRLEAESDSVSSDLLSEAKSIFKDTNIPVKPVSAESNGRSAHTASHDAPHRVLPVRISAASPLMPFTPDDLSHARAGEQYRIIRTKIVQHPRSPRMMAVSSVDSGDGKTVTSVNVAAALALKNQTNVLLVDCDLRRGRIANLLGFPDTPGLTDLLSGSVSSGESIIQAQQFPNLHILPGGTRLANPTELLDSPQWRALCLQLRKQFDYVILDTPPIGSLADYDLIQAVADGILLVARPDYTNRTRCLNALNSISADRLIGVILNCVEDWFLSKSSSHYGYYGYSSDKKTK
jgi:capsular exopolysaccharide synthesis family protein